MRSWLQRERKAPRDSVGTSERSPLTAPCGAGVACRARADIGLKTPPCEVPEGALEAAALTPRPQAQSHPLCLGQLGRGTCSALLEPEAKGNVPKAAAAFP